MKTEVIANYIGVVVILISTIGQFFTSKADVDRHAMQISKVEESVDALSISYEIIETRLNEFKERYSKFEYTITDIRDTMAILDDSINDLRVHVAEMKK